MKIPTLGGPRVQSQGISAPVVSPNLRRVDSSLSEASAMVGRGVGSLAKEADQALTAEQQQFDKAKREGAALAEADKLLEQQERAARRLQGGSGSRSRIDDAFDGIDTSKGGFLATTGLKAAEGSAAVIDGLEADAKEISETISDAGARARFNVKSREALLAFRRQVEGHVAKQVGVAKEETTKGLISQALASSSAGVPDFDSWLAFSRQAESAIDELAASPEAAAAHKAAFRSENSFAMTKGLLAQGRVDDAATFLETNRGIFGARFDEASSMVSRAKAGVERDRIYGEGVKLVDTTAEGLRDADGFVDGDALERAVDTSAFGHDVRPDVERHLRETQAAEAQKKRKAILDAENDANSAELARRPMLPGTWEFLKKYDADFLLARRYRAEARADAARARANGGRGGAADARREQADLDEAFRYRLEAELARDSNASPDAVRQQFVIDYTSKYGRPVDVSDAEWERAGASSARSVKRAGTQEEAQDKADAKSIDSTIRAAAKRKKSKTPLDEGDVDAWTGRAVLALHALEKEKGRRLTSDERAAFDAELDMDVADSLKSGRLVADPDKVRIVAPRQAPAPAKKGSLDMPEMDLTAPTRTLKSYLYSPDRKQRRAKYSDGTLGEIEQVK
ncbi:MAG: hypothetical protein QM817_10330 [Archangium sp.]